MKRGGVPDTLTEDSSLLDEQLTEDDAPDGLAEEDSMPVAQSEEGSGADDQAEEGDVTSAQDEEETVPGMQTEEGNLPDTQTDAEDGVNTGGQMPEDAAVDLAGQMAGDDASETEGGVSGQKKTSGKEDASAEQAVSIDNISAEDELGLSNDELFEGYLKKLFYGDSGQAPYSLGLEDRLLNNEEEKTLYRELRNWIFSIAEGKTDHTQITFGEDIASMFTADTREQLSERISGLFSRLIKLLLADCPYELYWFDKTTPYSCGYSPVQINDKYFAESLIFSFPVSVDYADKTQPSSAPVRYYYIDTDRIDRVNTAKRNAKAIVDKYAGLNDYDRMKAYKDEICARTDYDYDAFNNGKDYGDTWQLVSVFDDDEDTKVVCEGYAKAFAYLCELSSFKSNKIKCYIVSGVTSGPHMWNIVTMDDGKNYLVDVTNSESDTIGESGGLFLAGTKAEADGSYVFELKIDLGAWISFRTITYTYKEETRNLYAGTDILTLADKNYEPMTPVSVSIENKNYPVSYTYGQTAAAPVLENFNISVTGTADDIAWDLKYRWYEGDQTGQDKLESNFSEEAPVNAGIYTLVAAISADGYGTAETRILITISKAALSADMLKAELPGEGGLVNYTGSSYAVKVQGTGIASGLLQEQIQVKYRKDGETKLLTEAKEIGSYQVVVSVTGNSNFEDAENLEISGASFEIKGLSLDPELTAELSPVTSNSDWARAVKLTAPEGYLISLSLDEEFKESADWEKEEALSDGEHPKQTKITYYLKQTEALGGAICIDPQYAYAYIDRTAPDFAGSENGIHIEESAKWWQTLLTTITFGYYRQNNATIKASDDLSGIKAYYYFIDEPDNAQAGSEMGVLTKEQLDEKASKGELNFTESAEGSFSFTDDKAYVVYAYAVDNAGNKSDYICSEGIIRDTASPSLEINIDEENISDASVAFTVGASENADGFYMVKKAADEAPAGIQDFAAESGGVYTANDGVQKIELNTSPGSAVKNELECNTAYCIYMIAVDKAGNISGISRADFITKKKIPVFTQTEIPTIRGVYGQKISEMELVSADAGTSESEGTWKIAEGQSAIPSVGDTGTYQIEFVPDDTDTYENYLTETTVEIVPKPMKVKIKNAEKIFGEEDPKLEFELAEDSALAANDQPDSLGIILTVQKDSEESPGTYTIIGTAANKNYEITFQKGTLTVHKKPAAVLPGSPEQRNYTSSSGSGESPVQISIKEKLPDDAGAVDSYKVEVSGNNKEIVAECKMSEEGVLTYRIPANAAASGSSAVITVTVAAANYESFSYIVNVALTEKRQPVPDREIALAEGCSLVYGDDLSKVSFAEVNFVVEGTQESVEGTLSVQNPDQKPNAGASEIGWVFTPADTEHYDRKTGTVIITVERRAVIIENSNYKTNYTYTGKEIQAPQADQFSVNHLVEGDGWDVSANMDFTWYKGESDTEENRMQGAPADAGKYLLKAELKESGNYKGAFILVSVTIERASIADAVLDHENEGSGGWYHGDVTITPPVGYMISADKNIWKPQLVITEDRQGPYYYYLKQDGTDIISEEKQMIVNRDTVLPTGSITVAGSMWDRFLETISFGFYTRTEDVVTIQAEDAASGMDGGKIEYYIADENEIYAGEIGKTELDQLPAGSWKVLTDQAKITKNRGNIVYARLTDLAGNVAYLSTDMIIHDDISPKMSLIPEGEAYTDTLGSSNAYSQRVIYTVQVEDSNSSVKEVSLQLDGKEIAGRSDNKSVEIAEPGIHTLAATAEDHAGNKVTKMEQFRVYGTYKLELSGGPSVSDGKPLEPGTDFAISAEGSGAVSYSYSDSKEGARTAGLPAKAGTYWIHVNVAEDTEHCYMPQYAVFSYIIKSDDGSGNHPGGDGGLEDNPGGDGGSGDHPGGDGGLEDNPGSNGGSGDNQGGNDSGSGNPGGNVPDNTDSGSNGSGSDNAGNNSDNGSSGSGNAGNNSDNGSSGSGNAGNNSDNGSSGSNGSGGTAGNGNSGNNGSGSGGSTGSNSNSGGSTGSNSSSGGSSGNGGYWNGNSGSSGSSSPGTGSGKVPASTHKTETKSDGTIVETSKQTASDGTVTETEKQTKPDGTVTETEKQTAPDGTVTEEVTEKRTDGTVTQTIVKTKKDGTKTETVTEKHVNGTKTETVTENESNGTTIKSVTETASDGSAYVTICSKGADTNGNVISRMTVRKIASSGTVMQTVEKSTFMVSQTKAVVTTVKDSSDEIVKATANLTVQGVLSASGSLLNLSGFVTDRIAREAGTQNVQITVNVKDDKNALLYKLTVEKKDLTAGNELYVYGYDAETKTYTMVNAVKYAVSDTNSISVRVPDKSNYILLNKTQKAQADRKILKTIKLAKTSKTAVIGEKVKVNISKKANTKSIAKITYTSSDKKIAVVSKNGIIKAKSRGNAQVKAKVAMKNGKTKTLTMKLKVR